jgi:hypothetical protein
MEKIDLAKENLVLALERLGDAIKYLEKVRAMDDQQVAIVMDKEELADRLSLQIPAYYKIMGKYAELLKAK